MAPSVPEAAVSDLAWIAALIGLSALSFIFIRLLGANAEDRP